MFATPSPQVAAGLVPSVAAGCLILIGIVKLHEWCLRDGKISLTASYALMLLAAPLLLAAVLLCLPVLYWQPHWSSYVATLVGAIMMAVWPARRRAAAITPEK